VTETGSQCFRGRLYELPSNYTHIMNVAMDVPANVSLAFGLGGNVAVAGTADGHPIQATLVPMGGGRHRLFLNQKVRTAIGKGPGDDVEIEVEFDTSDRMPALPPDLEQELAANDALGPWAALQPSRRKECLVALADAKTERTRNRRVARIVEAAIKEGTPRL